jgi:putative transposase
VEYRSTAHAVHLLTYHVVFCPKYRRPVLTGPVVPRLRALVDELAAEHGWTVVELAVQPDHVHLCLRCLPEDAPHRAVRAVKGRTSRVLRREFPALRRRLPSLWTRRYFCCTAGNVSAAAVRRYVAAQRGV